MYIVLHVYILDRKSTHAPDNFSRPHLGRTIHDPVSFPPNSPPVSNIFPLKSMQPKHTPRKSTPPKRTSPHHSLAQRTNQRPTAPSPMPSKTSSMNPVLPTPEHHTTQTIRLRSSPLAGPLLPTKTHQAESIPALRPLDFAESPLPIALPKPTPLMPIS